MPKNAPGRIMVDGSGTTLVDSGSVFESCQGLFGVTVGSTVSSQTLALAALTAVGNLTIIPLAAR